jgi:hypothetical protein
VRSVNNGEEELMDDSKIMINQGMSFTVRVPIINPYARPMQYIAELYLISPDGKKVLIDKKSGTLGPNLNPFKMMVQNRPILSRVRSMLGDIRQPSAYRSVVVFGPINTDKYEPGKYRFKVECYKVSAIGLGVLPPQLMSEKTYDVSINPIIEAMDIEVQAHQNDEKKVI